MMDKYISMDVDFYVLPQSQRLIASLGGLGMYAYQGLIYKLAKYDNSLAVQDLDLVAYELRVDQELLQKVVYNFGLFEITNEKISCEYVQKWIDKMEEITEAKSNAGKLGAEKRWNKSVENGSAIAEPWQSYSRAIAENSKENKIKENKIKIKESIKEKIIKKESEEEENLTYPLDTPLIPPSTHLGGQDLQAPTETITSHPARDKPLLDTKKILENGKSAETPQRFEEFWGKYPKKIAKQKALKAYKKALTKTSEQELMDGFLAHLPELSAKEYEYIPHPSTWINQERWADPVYTEVVQADQKAKTAERSQIQDDFFSEFAKNEKSNLSPSRWDMSDIPGVTNFTMDLKNWLNKAEN